MPVEPTPDAADVRIVRANSDTVVTPDAPPAVPGPALTAPSPLAALAAGPQGVLIFDARWRVLHVTAGFRAAVRLPAAHPADDADLFDVLRGGELTPDSVASLRQCLAAPGRASAPSTHPLHLRDHSVVQLHLSQPAPDVFVACVQSSSPSDAEQNADTDDVDHLTGLASRRRLDSAMASLLRDGCPFAVLLLDLDRFKLVNDTLGHSTGDAVLRRVAQRLRVATRDHDLVVRLGADEFAVVLGRPATPAAAALIAGRMLDVVQRTYLVEGHTVNVGASLGMALAPEHGGDPQTLLRSADLALFQSKSDGRGRLSLFREAMLERAVGRRTNELDLRRALPLRQFEVHYQPQVTMDGALVGFEALVRWRHPTRGLIAPNDFLPVAEEIGLIGAIGQWVLRAACREAATWPEALTIAVNAAPSQIDSETFAPAVARALAATGLAGSRLEIEITEGTLLCNSATVTRTLAALRELGVRIAMDDFGTGYASLSQLAAFPFDKIKIDRSLAGVSGDDVRTRAVVRAITALGHSLGVCTLAEGVETPEQLARLRHDGCSGAQGYLFSRPMPAVDVPATIAKLYQGPCSLEG